MQIVKVGGVEFYKERLDAYVRGGSQFLFTYGEVRYIHERNGKYVASLLYKTRTRVCALCPVVDSSWATCTVFRGCCPI